MSAVTVAMWRIGWKRKVNVTRLSTRLGKECMAWDINIKYKIYQRLADELFFRIYRGIYPPGSKLPAYLALAKEAGSSPETVRKAIRELQEHGVVEKTRFGYFVTSNQEKILEYQKRYLAVIEQEYAFAKAKIGK